MGLLGKLMFWKKEEPELPSDFGRMGMGGKPELGLPGEESLGLPKAGGLPSEGGMPRGEAMAGMPGEFPETGAGFGAPRLEEASPEAEPLHPGYRPPPPAAAPMQQGAVSGKDIEIISLKLDSLKTTLEAINERLARLEKMAEGGGESRGF